MVIEAFEVTIIILNIHLENLNEYISLLIQIHFNNLNTVIFNKVFFIEING